MCRCARHERLRSAACVGAAVIVFGVAGCQPPLFTEREVRSPYDRYDVVRESAALPYVRDEFGRKLPNLRGRLVRAR